MDQANAMSAFQATPAALATTHRSVPCVTVQAKRSNNKSFRRT